jgi:cytochrome c-type biogenesis protein CcmH/NrfF
MRSLFLAGVLALALAAPGAAAEDPEGWAYQLANKVMSPFCPGRTLADCPSSKADSLRMWIIVQEASGRSKDEVENELYERYGDIMRAAPRAEGLGLAAYIAPVLFFALGGVVVIGFLRFQKRTPAAVPRAPVEAPADPELERIIDDELAG